MKDLIESLWSRALSESVGIKITTDEPVRLQDALVAARIESRDPALYAFSIQVRGQEVWIVRSKAVPPVKTSGEYKPIEE